MERKEFLKLITLGGMAIAVSPSIIGQTKEDQYSCGLFYDGKELNYKGYKRCVFNTDNLVTVSTNSTQAVLNIPPLTFPQTPMYGEMRVSDIRLFRDYDNMLILKYNRSDNLFDYWSVYHGTFTVDWNNN